MTQTTVMIVGAGRMAHCHLPSLLAQSRTTRIVGFVEVSPRQRDATRTLFARAKRACPPFYDSIAELVRRQGAPDTAFIITPHQFHLAHACACLTAGMDVLLEKPMVLNAPEACRLIRIRDHTKRLLVVAFPGSLSPAIKKAKQLLKAGAIGRVTHIAAWVHQGWKVITTGTWRQDPAVSGGGFLFDTGSHMVNTLLDLVGEDAVEVAALLDQRGTPVEINSVVSGRFRGGAMFSLTGAGDSIQCTSSIMVFGDRGVLEAGIWGEKLNIKTLAKPEWRPVPHPKSQGVWEQFLNVRAGKIANPCPAEVGLRFAQFMDRVRQSAAQKRAVRRR